MSPYGRRNINYRGYKGEARLASNSLQVDTAGQAIAGPRCINLPAVTALHVLIQDLTAGEVRAQLCRAAVPLAVQAASTACWHLAVCPLQEGTRV